MTSDNPPSVPAATRGAVVALITDVFFSVSVRSTIRGLGYDALLVRTADEVADHVGVDDIRLVVVDATAVRGADDWNQLGQIAAEVAPVLAFGPHKDVERLRAAKEAGVSRVVANSQFHREMAALIERYAMTSPRGDVDATGVPG